MTRKRLKRLAKRLKRRATALTKYQRAEVLSLQHDSGYTRAEAIEMVRAGGLELAEDRLADKETN